MVTTFRKWREDFDKELKTVTWLECESELESGKKVVKKLNCSVCTKFQAKILSRRNFSDRWILGAEVTYVTTPTAISTSSDVSIEERARRLREELTIPMPPSLKR